MLLTGCPKGIEILDRSQKIIQRGGGKFNIAATESMRQRRIDVFENLETVAYAGQSSGWNIKRSLELFTPETTDSVSGFSAFDRSQWHIFILIGYPIL